MAAVELALNLEADRHGAMKLTKAMAAVVGDSRLNQEVDRHGVMLSTTEVVESAESRWSWEADRRDAMLSMRLGWGAGFRGE